MVTRADRVRAVRAQTRWVRCVAVLGAGLVVGSTLAVLGPSPSPSPVHASGSNTHYTTDVNPSSLGPPAAPSQLLAQLPLAFEPNVGQAPAGVQFVGRAPGVTFLLSGSGLTILAGSATSPKHAQRPSSGGHLLPQPGTAAVAAAVRITFVGANSSAAAVPSSPLPGRVNYFLGNDPSQWRTNIPTYGRVELQNVYPGVDLAYYSNGGRQEHDWIVHPGADPGRVRLAVSGASSLALDSTGRLVMQTTAGAIAETSPVAYQKLSNGGRHHVAARYQLLGAGNAGIALGDYDRGRDLVIDPAIDFSTFYGGSYEDWGYGVATDSSGNIYLTGEAQSTDFPTLNAYQATCPGAPGNPPTDCANVFVAKLTPSGSPIYSTYLDGSQSGFSAEGWSVAADAAGNAYVVGETTATGFPLAHPLQSTCNTTCGFLSELSASGSQLLFSTILGDTTGKSQGAFGLAVDASANIYVAGETGSAFTTTSGAFTSTCASSAQCVYVMKLAPGGASVTYAALLGGNGRDTVNRLAIDGSGDVYLTGQASAGFPTSHPLITCSSSCPGGFVSELNAAGSALVYSTYFGGSGYTSLNGIAVDGSGNAYIAGTASTADVPLANAVQQDMSTSNRVGFVSAFAAGGGSLIYSTYIGAGGAHDYTEADGIAVDASGNAVASGYFTASNATLGTPSDLPVVSAFQPSDGTAFLTRFTPTGSLAYSSLLGGSGGDDEAQDVALDASDNAVVTGYTDSYDFPVAAAYQPAMKSPAGDYTAFVTKIQPTGTQGQLVRGALQSNQNSCLPCAAQTMTQGSHGDPVDTATGTLTESRVDISIPGRGLPFGVFRSYSTANATTSSPLGYGWTANGFMSLTIGPGGSTVTVNQDDGSQVPFTLSGSTYSAAPRFVATLVHNGDGTYTFTRGGQQRFVLSGSGQLLSESDLNGETTSLSYSGGQLSSITDPAGRTLTFAYQNGLLSSVTDPGGRIVRYGYNDSAGDLTDVTDVNGGNWHYTYDTAHRLLSERDPRGNTVTTHYDGSGRVDWQSDQLSRKMTFAYTGDPLSTAGGTTLITDPAGHASLEQYVQGVRIALTRSYGTTSAATWTYVYDPATIGVMETIDPNGNAWRAGYDASGNKLSSSDPVGNASLTTYNQFNEPVSAMDPKQVTTTLAYDANGNLLSTTTPLNGSVSQVTTYRYGDPSHPDDRTGMVDPDNNTWTYAYDADGDLTSTTDPLGDQTTSAYNSVGWLLSSVSPKGNVAGCGCSASNTTTYGYTVPGSNNVDEFGDVQTVRDPLGHMTTYAYDADRNLTSLTDGNGNVTTSVYDAANELTQTTRADGSLQTTDYNLDGTVKDQKDGKGNAIQTYGYDSLGRVSSETDALGNVTMFAHDGAGNLVSQQDPGGSCSASPKSGCTTRSYDIANELTAITYSDGSTPNVTSITYDPDGQRTAMHDGTGTSTWAYDQLRRLTSYKNGAGTAVKYAYNLRGLATTLTYPGNHAVTRGYDAAGRWTSVQDWLSPANTTTFGYDANGNLATETLPASTGVVDATAFDADNGITGISDLQATTTIFAATYARDSNEQVTTDSSAPTLNQNDKYTSLNQLCYSGASNSPPCSAHPPAGTAYGYDAADNLTQNGTTGQAFNAADELCWTLPGTSTTGCGNSTPPGATTFAYDSRGNRTTEVAPGVPSNTTTTMTYDQADRLTGFNGAAATYAYDGTGVRMAKTTSVGTDQMTWDVAGSLPELLQEVTGSTTVSYVDGPGGLPLEEVNGSTALYYQHDQLGSTRAIVDGSGIVQATYTYNAYGSTAASTGSAVAQPFRFAGQYFDTESGLYYLRARYYDPTTAQFLSRDPAVASTRSPYGYVAGNPLNATDPSGLVFTTDGGGTIDACDGYSAAHDYCEATLQLCADSFTRDACYNLGQAAVDRYNEEQSILNDAIARPCQLSSGKIGGAEESLTELARIVHVIQSVAIPEMNHQATCDASRDLGIFTIIVGGGITGGEAGIAAKEGLSAFDAGKYAESASKLLQSGIHGTHAVGFTLAGGALTGVYGGGC